MRSVQRAPASIAGSLESIGTAGEIESVQMRRARGTAAKVHDAAEYTLPRKASKKDPLEPPPTQDQRFLRSCHCRRRNPSTNVLNDASKPRRPIEIPSLVISAGITPATFFRASSSCTPLGPLKSSWSTTVMDCGHQATMSPSCYQQLCW